MAVSLVLILGGISSGKSEFAETWICGQVGDRPVRYVATAEYGDSDPAWAEKISRHKRRRPSHWQVDHAVGVDALQRTARAPASQPVLLDGLGVALASALDRDQMAQWDDACHDMMQREGLSVVVSDEVGLGMVPLTPSGRAFAQRLGECHQQLAHQAHMVILVVAGLPQWLKGPGHG